MFIAGGSTGTPASFAPEEGPCGPKFMSSYIAVLLLIVCVCAILIVGELGALVSYSSKSASPGMYHKSITCICIGSFFDDGSHLTNVVVAHVQPPLL
jgi:hypothetical protein